MIDKENWKDKDWTRIIRTIVMIVIYFAMAAMVMYTNIFRDLFRGNTTLQFGFALVFLIYGLWRGYRLFKEIKDDE